MMDHNVNNVYIHVLFVQVYQIALLAIQDNMLIIILVQNAILIV